MGYSPGGHKESDTTEQLSTLITSWESVWLKNREKKKAKREDRVISHTWVWAYIRTEDESEKCTSKIISAEKCIQ